MRKITWCFLVFICFSGSLLAQNYEINVTEYNYMQREELIDENGSLTINYDIKSSVPDGSYKIYYDTSKERLHMAGEIVNGHKEGVWKYCNEFGLVVREVSYQKGVKNGLEKRFNLNGNLIDEIEYKQGIADGKWIQYYDSGTIKSQITMSNGVVSEINTYDQAGNIIEQK